MQSDKPETISLSKNRFFILPIFISFLFFSFTPTALLQR